MGGAGFAAASGAAASSVGAGVVVAVDIDSRRKHLAGAARGCHVDPCARDFCNGHPGPECSCIMHAFGSATKCVHYARISNRPPLHTHSRPATPRHPFSRHPIDHVTHPLKPTIR